MLILLVSGPLLASVLVGSVRVSKKVWARIVKGVDRDEKGLTIDSTDVYETLLSKGEIELYKTESKTLDKVRRFFQEVNSRLEHEPWSWSSTSISVFEDLAHEVWAEIREEKARAKKMLETSAKTTKQETKESGGEKSKTKAVGSTDGKSAGAKPSKSKMASRDERMEENDDHDEESPARSKRWRSKRAPSEESDEDVTRYQSADSDRSPSPIARRSRGRDSSSRSERKKRNSLRAMSESDSSSPAKRDASSDPPRRTRMKKKRSDSESNIERETSVQSTPTLELPMAPTGFTLMRKGKKIDRFEMTGMSGELLAASDLGDVMLPGFNDNLGYVLQYSCKCIK